MALQPVQALLKLTSVVGSKMFEGSLLCGKLRMVIAG